MEKINLKENARVKEIIKAGFPQYAKLTAFIAVFPESGININSYWSGGSRDEFCIVHLPTLTRKLLPTSTHPYFDMKSVEGSTPDVVAKGGSLTLIRLPVEFALVCAGTFDGRPATARVYLNSLLGAG